MELDVEPSQVEFAQGSFSARGAEARIAITELARKHAGKVPHPLNVVAEGSVGSTFPNACHVAEVEIDRATGACEVVGYVAVDDCGHAVNHSIVEGQVHGAVIQGAGQVFGEHVVYDPGSGQLLSGSFMDYAMPRAGLIPAMRLDESPVPSATNILGAKGVGEAGCGGSIPALANAVMNALRPLGVSHVDMPLNPNTLWQTIAAANTSR
jgi:carbon-monoxide dehydrogenase large subunit